MKVGDLVRYKMATSYGRKPLGRIANIRETPVGNVVAINSDGCVIKALEKNLEIVLEAGK